MEPWLSGLVGLFFAASLYMMLSKKIIRILLGVAMLGNGVNLLLFTAGRITRDVPPIMPLDAYAPPEGAANALPQALILTAIVISFSFLAFLLVLAFRAFQDLGTDDTDAMRVAEPLADPGPPRGY
ncbi:Na+/H+ antiporter subunit C [Chthonobacter albigriseus]|uniref:Na+/H+ antiporter subunit C n=1 Tax=Chthonobacter albigriseus TaxID=1683161 RepID=UPI0015EEA7C2|nr:Na+/H+ antiporter subunit C [Chthonobacter albigriseus]